MGRAQAGPQFGKTLSLGHWFSTGIIHPTDMQSAWRQSGSVLQWGVARHPAVPRAEMWGLNSSVLSWGGPAGGSAAEGLSGYTAQAAFLPGGPQGLH